MFHPPKSKGGEEVRQRMIFAQPETTYTTSITAVTEYIRSTGAVVLPIEASVEKYSQSTARYI